MLPASVLPPIPTQEASSLHFQHANKDRSVLDISPDRLIDAASSIGIGILTIVAILLTAAVVKTFFRLILNKTYPSGSAFVSSIAQFSVIAFGLYQMAMLSGVDPTVILAIVAIVTAGIAIAGEVSFAEVMGGLKIIMSRRFSVGDYVTVAGGVSGRVASVGLFSTIVEVNSRGLVSISNKEVSDGHITNHDRIGGIETSIVIPMFDTHDIGAATALIDQVMQSSIGIKPTNKTLFGWGTGGQEYAIIFRVLEYDKRRETSSVIAIGLTTALVSAKFPVGYVNFYRET